MQAFFSTTDTWYWYFVDTCFVKMASVADTALNHHSLTHSLTVS